MEAGINPVELKKNDTVVCDVTAYTHEGLGVARTGGRVLFVRGAARGDRARLKITKVTSSVGYAIIEALEMPSPHRVTPDCPAWPRCGGCDFRHITYEEELRHKRERVEETLRRLGGIELSAETVYGSELQDGYRNKAALPVGFDKNGHPVTGYYRAHSNDIVPVDSCRLQGEEENRAAAALRAWLKTTGFRGLRHLFLRRGRSGILAALIAVKKPPETTNVLISALREAAPSLCGVVWQRHRGEGSTILGESQTTLWGQDYIEDDMIALDAEGRERALTFRISVPSFYQINRPQAQRMYRKAVEYAGAFDTALDLYCGAGTMTLFAAASRPKAQLTGIEIVPQAIEDAKANARRNKVTNCAFLCGDAAIAARQNAQVVLVDPPRKGLHTEALEALLAIGPERIVYLSCDPATLARDCKTLEAGGYRAARLTVADFFPRTAHVETVVLLSKLKSTTSIEVKIDLDEMDLTQAESKATYDEIKAYEIGRAHV